MEDQTRRKHVGGKQKQSFSFAPNIETPGLKTERAELIVRYRTWNGLVVACSVVTGAWA
jgi:hypothetical protein